MKAMTHLLSALRGTIAVCGTLLFAQATWAQTVEIESPAHDALMFEERVTIRAVSSPNTSLLLLHEDQIVGSQETDERGRAHFADVRLPLGPSQWVVQQEWDPDVTDSVFVHVAGPLSALQIDDALLNMPADTTAVHEIYVYARDAWGMDPRLGEAVTVQLERGQLLNEDAVPEQPGTQLPVVNGQIVLRIRPAAQVGPARLVVRSDAVEEAQTLHFSTRETAWNIVGTADGQIGWNEKKAPAGSRGAADLEEGTYTQGRLAYFARGTLGNRWLLTSSYDSDRYYDSQVFRFLRPEQVYPIYGDASSIFYEAPTMSKLYARIERDGTFAQYGDFATRLSQAELTSYQRVFTGVSTQTRTRHLTTRAFAAQTEQTLQIDQIRGEGISGLYDLSARSRGLEIVEGSEQIVLQVRDRLHPEKVLQERRQHRYADYDIDYEAATLLFKRPVASYDADENPQFIVVTYETKRAIDKQWVSGAHIYLDGGQRWGLGTTAVNEERAEGDYLLAGVEGRLRFSDLLSISSEVGRSRVRGQEDAWAWKVEGEGALGRSAGYELYYRDAQGAYLNTSSTTARPGERKVRGRLHWRIASRLKLVGEAYQTNDDLTGQERRSGLLSSQMEWGPVSQKMSVESTRLSGASAPSTSSTTLNGGLEWTASERLRLGIERDQTLGDEELNYRPTLNRVNGRWMLRDGVEFVMEHAFRDESLWKSSYTNWGIESTLVEDLNMYARYQLDSGLRREQNQAIVGLRHRYSVTDAWTFDTTFERMRTLRGTGDNDFTAYSIATQYLPADPLKASARFERRDGRSTDKMVVTSAGDWSVARTWSVLAKHTFLDESHLNRTTSRMEPLRRHQLSLGLAHRPYHDDVINAILKYELKSESDNRQQRDAQKTSHIGSIETLVQPAARLEWYARYTFKLNRVRTGQVKAHALTDLWSTHLRYEWTQRWDTLAELRVLNQYQQDDLNYGSALELGYIALRNTRLALGYNIAGNEDRDLSNASYWARGPYMKVQIKFSERDIASPLRGLNSGVQ